VKSIGKSSDPREHFDRGEELFVRINRFGWRLHSSVLCDRHTHLRSLSGASGDATSPPFSRYATGGTATMCGTV
jgi:hypothetical protein